MSIILLLLTTIFFSTAQAMPWWSKPADIGYWFYQDPMKRSAKSPSKEDCNDPKKWHSSCGFIDPTQLKKIDNQARFAFEQQQYHALLRDLSVNPNDLTTVLHWQRFNHWVIGQAMAAAYSTQFLVTQHPELDANVSQPFSRFGIALLKKIQTQKQQQWFEMLAKHSLLVLFSRSDCPYCRAEAPLVQHLSEKTHIQLWNASLDSQQLPGFEHVLRAPETLMPARILKVNMVPALFLYLPAEHKNNGTWIRLATGITPEDVIEQRVVRFIKHYRGALIDGIKSGVKIVNKRG